MAILAVVPENWTDDASGLPGFLISTAALISRSGQWKWPDGRFPLGPSPVLGARFYGLGNEYLGIFLGALLVGQRGC